MGDSIAEMNSSYLATRAATLNSAISTALASKDGASPQQPAGERSSSKPAKGAPAAAAAPAPAPASTPAPDASSGASAPAAGDTAADDAAEQPPPDTSELLAQSEDAPADGDTPAALTELQALGKKKDLRALEKKLGLPEGHLGVQNHDYAAYRRRQEELSTGEANLHNAQQVLIERYAPHVKALQVANKGDLRGYADLIELQTGVKIEEFISYWSKNIQQLPQEVADFAAERRRKLQQGAATPETKQEPKTEPVTKEQATARADKYISEEAGNHPAFKLEGAKEGVRKIWLSSYDKSTNGFKLTPQAAANEYVKQRKAQAEREAWILSGKTPPAPARTRTPPRRGQAESQPPRQLSREELIEQGARRWREQKARDGMS